VGSISYLLSYQVQF